MERRLAISTYLEVFVLVGMVTAGAALVYATTYQYSNALSGASLRVQNASIAQGVNTAVESFLLSNTGTVALPSFVISTPGIGSAQFYIALTDASSGAQIPPSPSSGTTPSSIAQSVGVVPGQSVLISIVISSSSEFVPGNSYELVVSSSAGAQFQQLVLATNA